MKDPSKNSSPKTSPCRNASTCSPASVDGTSPSRSLGGLPKDPSGPPAAPASPSAVPAGEGVLKTKGTSGRRSRASFKASVLLSSWASKWQALMGSPGWTPYSMTWKLRVTPAGRPIYALRASPRRTSDKGSGGALTGWPTASARDWKDTPGMATERPDGRSRLDQLPRVAALAGWPTPTSTNNGRGEDPMAKVRRGMEPGLTPADAAALAGWPTPDAQCFNLGSRLETTLARHQRLKEKHGNGNGAGMVIAVAALMATPIRVTSSHEVLIGSGAGMDAGGLLSPDHSRWLMGYPEAWSSCAPETPPTELERSRASGTPSSPRSPRPSSLSRK